MSENNETPQFYYWLNPASLKDKVYRVHLNHTIENNESSSPQWAYSTIPPEAYSLGWRYVCLPHLLTDEERKEIEEAKTKKAENKVLNEVQAELLNEIARAKKRKCRTNFIGDTEQIADGITAFFIKRTSGNESDYGSVLSLLERDENFDVYDWYEAYWGEQKSFAERLNTKKTNSQGRLTNEAFKARFIEDHLIQEQESFKKSERFFGDDFHYETAHLKSVIHDYTEGYIDWVAGKSEDIIQGYKTDKTREQMLSFFDSLMRKNFFEKENPVSRNDFADVFSGQIMRTRVTYKASKAKLASIIHRLTGKDVDHKEVNQRFSFPKTGVFRGNDWHKKEQTGLKSCYEEVFKKKK